MKAQTLKKVGTELTKVNYPKLIRISGKLDTQMLIKSPKISMAM